MMEQESAARSAPWGTPSTGDGGRGDGRIGELTVERFHLIAASLDFVYWVFELQPREHVSYVSPAYERIWGCSVQSLYDDAARWMAAIHGDDRPAVEAAFGSMLADIAAFDFKAEYRIVRPDGSLRWIADRGRPSFDAAGRAQRVFGVAEDITARKLAEQRARDSERQFAALIGGLPQLVWACDPDGSCDYLSPQWLDFAGLTDAPESRAAWMGRIHPDDVTGAIGAWLLALQDQLQYEQQFRLRRHDGVYRWFRTRALPMRGEDGALRRWLGTCTDIDDLKQAESALREERERLDRMTHTAPGILHTYRRDADGHASFPYGAERIAALFELPVDVVRRDAGAIRARIDPEMRERLAASVDVSARGMTPWLQQFRIATPHRGEVWVEGHSMPVPDADGSINWHGSLSDITYRRRQEDQLRELTHALEERVQARTAELQDTIRELEAFSYSVSHDLRAPLRAIDGFAAMLLRDYAPLLPANGRRYIGIVGDSARKLGQLIDDLLAFSRLGRQPLRKHPVDVGRLVREVIRQLQPMQQGRDVAWRIGELPPCDADLAMLRQAWINLLSNALKYSRPRAKAVIEIGGRLVGATPEYHVRDNGSGFDMAHAHKLFGVFERLHRDEEFEGTGVGLALVQRIVQRHGGAIRAEGAIGQGATFTFSLGA